VNTVAVARAVRAARSETMQAARDWVRDSVVNYEVVDDAPEDHVVLYVNAKYPGGWRGFLNDQEEL